MSLLRKVGGRRLIPVIVKYDHDVAAAKVEHGAQISTRRIFQQPHPLP